MKDLLQENNRQKHQFKSYYCAGCLQAKPCQLLTGWSSEWKSYCCQCYYKSERDREVEYSSYEKFLGSKRKEKESGVRQLQFLRGYSGCPECGSKEVDAYSLYEKNRLVCWVCLIKKEGGASSPISFLGQRGWFQKKWKIDISWWLEKGSLPVNAKCAKQWQNNSQHLPNRCDCLEKEVQETYELFASSLREMREKLEECRCEVSPKVRVGSDDCAWCEKCKRVIGVASKKRVIKNRNDPRFWGIESKFKILCLRCIGRGFYGKLSGDKRKTFNKYMKRDYK